jgi:hypothetical protein
MMPCRSSSLIAPVALRRDAERLTSSSKKMRLSASLPRFGMNLSYASPATCAVSLYHKQSRRPRAPVAKLGSKPNRLLPWRPLSGGCRPTLPCDTIPIKRVAMDFGTSFACFVGSRYGKRSKSAVVTGEPVQRRGVARRIVCGCWNISPPLRSCVRQGDRPVCDALHARPAIERGSARACERWLLTS